MELHGKPDTGAADLAAHIADTDDAHDATAISTVAAGGLSSTNVGAALNELDTEKQPLDADLTAIAALADPNADRILFWDDSLGAYTFLTPGTNLTITGTTIDAAGSSGAALTVSEDGTPVDATVTTIDFLGADFDVSESPEDEVNVSIASAIARVASAVMDGDTAGGVLAGTYPSPSFASDMATQAELDAHVNDTSAAHAASAIGFTPNGSIAATDVQAAIQEVRDEASGGSVTANDANLVFHMQVYA